MKKINILLTTIFVFFLSHNLAIAETACEGLENKIGLNMVVGFGKMYFTGYNHGKGTNIKYTKSKMKDFILASCEADPTIEIDKIFANAADTNFKPPSMPESVVNNKQQFLLDKWWGTGKGECDLKDDYVMIFLWDNEGNEFWIVSNKFSEELTSKQSN